MNRPHIPLSFCTSNETTSTSGASPVSRSDHAEVRINLLRLKDTQRKPNAGQCWVEHLILDQDTWREWLKTGLRQDFFLPLVQLACPVYMDSGEPAMPPVGQCDKQMESLRWSVHAFHRSWAVWPLLGKGSCPLTSPPIWMSFMRMPCLSPQSC